MSVIHFWEALFGIVAIYLFISAIRDCVKKHQAKQPIDWEKHPEFFIRSTHVKVKGK